jgi:hypothetical protein
VVIGVQFVCTGIVTEMLARTYFEAGTARTYLVRETLGEPDALGTVDAFDPFGPLDSFEFPPGDKRPQGQDGPGPGGAEGA